jgi:hypothetical protein
MQPIVWRQPTQLLMAGGSPVSPGGDRAGWISGLMSSVLGGTTGGTGVVAGAVTITGGKVTAVGAPTNGGSGYPGNARFEVEVTGDGVGARVWARTNSSGVITSFQVISQGSGYTAASINQRAGASTMINFDLGPNWHQYNAVSFIPSFVYGLIETCAVLFYQDGLSSRLLYAPQFQTGVASSFSGLSATNAPVCTSRVISRFCAITIFVASTANEQDLIGLALS